MNKMQFEGIVVLKNGETRKFDNIAKYNEFVVDNYEQIESTESRSKFIQVQENKDESNKNQESKRKLSNLVSKAIELVKEDANENRCNMLGENIEDSINTYINNDDIILDIEECINILNDSADKFQKDWSNSNEELKKLESEFNKKKDEVKNNLNKVRFIDALKNMCQQYAPIIDKDDVKTEIVETKPQELFDFNEFPWCMLEGYDKDFSGKITGIKNFLKALRDE